MIFKFLFGIKCYNSWLFKYIVQIEEIVKQVNVYNQSKF
jgi:hypothetical protein